MARVISYNNRVMNILVTGAKGFVGRNLVHNLIISKTERLVVMVI